MNLVFPGKIAVAATKTALVLGSGTNTRPRILSYNCWTDGTPTSDQGIDWQLRRCTALGTTTAVTPKSTDPSDEGLTFTMTGGSNATAEPTYSGFIEEIVMNPRLTYKWQAYDRADEIIVAAGAATGVGWQIQAAGGSAGNFGVNAHAQQ